MKKAKAPQSKVARMIAASRYVKADKKAGGAGNTRVKRLLKAFGFKPRPATDGTPKN
jgi:hypothetical protein